MMNSLIILFFAENYYFMDNCANNYSVIILTSDILRRVIKQFLSIIIYIYLILGLRKGVLKLCARHYQSGEALPEEY